MLFTKQRKLVTSPSSGSSSFKTLQSSQLKFQIPSSIPFPLVSTVISSCTPTFPSSPTLSVHPSFSAAPPTSRHHLVTHLPSKALPENLISFLYVVEHIAGEMQISPPVLPHVPCELILELIIAGKDNNEIVSCRYSFLTFFIPLFTLYLAFAFSWRGF